MERTFLSPEPMSGLSPAGPLPQLDSVVATIGTIVNAEVASMGGQGQSTVAPQVVSYPGEEAAEMAPPSPVGGGAGNGPQMESIVKTVGSIVNTEAASMNGHRQGVENQQNGQTTNDESPAKTDSGMSPAVAPSAAVPAQPVAPSIPDSPPPVLTSALTPADIELLSRLNVALLSDSAAVLKTEVPLGELAYMQTERTTPSKIHYFVPASPTPGDEPANPQFLPRPVEALEGRVSGQGESIPASEEPTSTAPRPAHVPVRSPTMTGITGGGLRPYTVEELAALEEADAPHVEPLPLHPVVDSVFSPFLSHSIASRFIPDAFESGAGAGTKNGASAGPGTSEEEAQRERFPPGHETRPLIVSREQEEERVPPGHPTRPLVIDRETINPDQITTMLMSTRGPTQQTSTDVIKKQDTKAPAEKQQGGSETVDASGESPSDSQSSEQAALEADDLLMVLGEAVTDSDGTTEPTRPAATSIVNPSSSAAPPVVASPAPSAVSRPSESETEDGSGASDEPAVQPIFTLSSLFRPGVQADGGFLSFSGEIGSAEQDGSGEGPSDREGLVPSLSYVPLDDEAQSSDYTAPSASTDQTEVVKFATEVDGSDHSDYQIDGRQGGGHDEEHHAEHDEGHHHEAHDDEEHHKGYYITAEGEKHLEHRHEGEKGHHENHEVDHGSHHEGHQGHEGHHGDHEKHGAHGEHGAHGNHGAHGEHHKDHGDHGDHHSGHHGDHDAGHGSGGSAAGGATLQPPPEGSLGLEDTLQDVDDSTDTFVENMNRLALTVYRNLAPDYRKQNMVMSPLGVSSSLALVFLGARGETAHELDTLLRLDSMTSFNPHVGYFKFLRYMNRRDQHASTAVCNAILTHEVSVLKTGMRSTCHSNQILLYPQDNLSPVLCHAPVSRA